MQNLICMQDDKKKKRKKKKEKSRKGRLRLATQLEMVQGGYTVMTKR